MKTQTLNTTKVLFSITLILISLISCSDKYKNRTEVFALNAPNSEGFEDFIPLANVLSNKRVIQIGESGHGMKEYFQLKTRLVKYLHEQLSYDVIAVEGALADCATSYLKINNLSDTLLMKNCFYRTWNFEEALPLFSYIKSTQDTPNPLILTGFDNIPTGNFFPTFMQSLILDLDSSKVDLFNYAYEGLSKITNGTIEKSQFASYKTSILDSLVAIESFVRNHQLEIQRRYENHPHISSIILQSLNNVRMTISIEGSEYNRNTLEKMRDQLMSEHLLWLADSIYKNEKIIVWAHNAHISKAYSQIPDLNDNRKYKRQGEFINQAIGEETYSLGLYGYEGTAWAYFIQDQYNFRQPKSNSLEVYIKNLGHETSWVHIGQCTKSDSTFHWLYDTIPSYEWGRNEQIIVPKDHYDGILFINKVSPPTPMFSIK